MRCHPLGVCRTWSLRHWAGAMLLLGTARLSLTAADRVWRYARKAPVARHAPDLESLVNRLGGSERDIFATLLRRQPIAKNANEALSQQLTTGQIIADHVARFGGSWTFLGLFASFMLGWMLMNIGATQPFDPYPFILLNLVLSCLAAVQAPVIMMSQNRQAAHDRIEAQQDYQVNLKAEMEIGTLRMKLDTMIEHEWQSLLELQRQQVSILSAIQERVQELEERSARNG